MKILVVEDDRLMAEVVVQLLANYNYAADIAEDGLAGLAMVEAFEYDLVISDIGLPQLDGIELCKRLRDRYFSNPILLLSGTSGSQNQAIALNAGADDYVVKPFDTRELIARVQALLRRPATASQPILTWGDLAFDPNRRRVTYADRLLKLTPKEYAILELLLRTPQMALNASSILDRAWTADEVPANEAVRGHIKELRAKLTAVGAPKDLIKTVHRVGYQLNLLYATELGKPLTNPQVVELAAVNEELRDVLAQLRSTQDTLRAREEHYRLLSEISPVGIFRNDPSGACTYVNERTAQLVGLPPVDCLGRNWVDTLHPDDRQWVYAAWCDFVARSRRDPATTHNFECRHLHPDGKIVWVLVNVVPERDRTGTITSYVGTLTDITKRKQAEAQVLRAAELDAFRVTLADALRDLADPIEIQATASRILGEYLGANRVVYFEVRGANYVVERDYVNGAVALMGSYPMDTYSPQLLAEYRAGRIVSSFDVAADRRMTPAERSAYAALQIAAHIGIPLVKGGEFVAGLAIHHAQPREWLPDEIALAAEVAERTWATIERARAEAALQDSEEKYRTLVCASSRLVWTADPAGNIIAEVAGWEAFTGQTFDEYKNFGWLDALHPDDAERVGQLWQTSIDNQTQIITEYRIRTRSGDYRRIAVQGEPLLAADGSLRGWVGTITDVEDVRRAEESLRDSEQRLRVTIANLPSGATFVVDRDLRYLLAEGEALYAAGFTPADLVGKTIFEAIAPELAADYERRYRQALAGEPFIHEHNTNGSWYVTRGTPLRQSSGEIYAVLAVSYDITDRKQAEAQMLRAAELDAFRVTLADGLRDLADPIEMQDRACGLLAECLGVDRAYYIEIKEAERYTRIERDYVRGDSPSLVGVFPIAEYDWTLPLLQRGETVIIVDAATADVIPEVERMAMAGVRIAAYISTPLVKADTLRGALCVTEAAPREWTQMEVELVRETADRIWSAVERARAEAALFDSESKFHAFVNTSSDIIYEMSADWRQMRSLEGKEFIATTEDVRSDWTEDYIPATDRLQVWATISRAIATRSTFELQHRVIRIDGSVGWTFSRAIPLLDEVGEIVKWFGAASDITDRVEAELALQESEAKFRSMTELVPALLWQIEPNGQAISWNPSWSDYTGQTLAESQNDGWIAAIHPEDRPHTAQIFADAFATQQELEVEHRIRRHDGEYRWFTVRQIPIRDERGAVVQWFGAAIDIQEQHTTQVALGESEAKYRSLFTSMDEGYILCDVIFDENEQPLDILYLEANPAAVRMTGTELVGKTTRQLDPNFEAHWLETWSRVAKTGVGERHELSAAPLDAWYNFYIFKVGAPEETKVAAIYEDITDRKRREANRAILIEIADALVGLENIAATMEQLGETIGRYFGVKYCLFAEHIDGYETTIATYGWNDADVPTIAGTYQMRDYISDAQRAAMLAGEPLVVNDIATDGRVSAENYGALNIYSFIAMPLLRDRQWQFQISIAGNHPRIWREDEIDLLREIVDRIWIRLERARAEAALRESEAKYRTLFESIDRGFFLVKVLFDANETAYDYRFMEVNGAFAAHSGLADAVGKTILELVPDLEPEWIEQYAQVAKSGNAIRFEADVPSMHRIFDVYAYPSGTSAENVIAVLFTDITERKRQEQRQAFLLKLGDALRSIADPLEIQVAACRLLGETLGVDRAYYVEVNEAEGYARVERNYLRGDSPSIVGTFRLADYGWTLPLLQRGETIVVVDVENSDIIPAADRAAMAAVRMAAHISMPVNKQGALRGALCVTEPSPRQWSEREVELVSDTAERIWGAIERAHAEAALRESEEKYRTLFESIDNGFCLLEVLFDADETAYDYRFVEVNEAFAAQCGLADAVGKTILELVPDLEPQWAELYGRVAKSGNAIRFEADVPSMHRIFDIYAYPSGASGDRVVAVLFTDISDRKRHEANLAFLAELAADFARLTSEVSLMHSIGERLVTHLRLDGFSFADVDEQEETLAVKYTWNASGETNLPIYRIADYVSADFAHMMRSGHEWVIHDTQRDDRADAAASAAVGVGAYVTVPYHRDGEWQGSLTVTSRSAREWRADEIALVEEVSNRLFPRLERARAEAALQASETKYRTLFESIDEGFCVFEMIYDETGTAIDYRFLEVNRVFERQTGIANAVGKLGSEIAPSTEIFWLETYDNVLQTGEPMRLESYNQSTERWYSAYASRVGGAGSRQVCTVFDDITDRKRTEANLAFLAEVSQDLVRLTNIDETMNALGEKIGRHFDLSACAFAELFEAAEIAVIDYTWQRSDAPSLAGTYRTQEFFTPEVRQLCLAGAAVVIRDVFDDPLTDGAQYATLNIGSFLSIPLVRDGEWRFLLVIYRSEPHDWRDDEIELTRELANRIWTRLERARAEEIVAADLRDTQLLRELAARLVTEGNIDTLYRDIISTAIALTDADGGTVQILDDATQDLLLIATQGFDRAIVEHFYRVNVSSHTSCGAALRAGVRSFIDFDVPESEDPDGSLRMHVEAGYLSAQSTPLIARSGKAIGMMSTHWREHHRPSDRQLRLLDLLARQAADAIEQRQTAVALCDREEQLRLATEASQVGLWFWDLETDCLTWTEQCKALFGLPADTEMSYAVFLAAIHPDDRDRTRAAVSRSIAERTEYDLEYRTCWPDGTIHWIAAKGSCIYDPTGTPLQMMGVAININDRKQAQIDLADRNQELDSFVYVVSHDLKAPLRGISNLSQWIEEDLGTGLSADNQQQMAQLRDRVHRMELMIDGLLQYARVGRTDAQI